MRILHLTNYLPGFHSHAGGAEHACLRTIRLLADSGTINTVWTLPPDRASSPGAEAGFTRVTLPILEAPLPARLRRCVEVVKWYAWQSDPRALRAGRAWLAANPVDAIMVYNAQFLSLELLALARARGIRIIQVIYDYWLFCPLTTLVDGQGRICRRTHGPGCVACLPPVLKPVQRFFLAARQRRFPRLLEAMDGYVVLSAASGKLLQDFGIPPEKISVVPVPMDLAQFQPDDTPVEPGLIVFAGWLQRRKGLEHLLQALTQVVETRPEAHLEILGMPVKWEREYEARIRALAATPLLAGRVCFRDHLTYPEVKRRIREAAIVAIPEQWENMCPILLLESLAMGKVVVASRIGGIPEYVLDGTTGFLVEWNDPADLAGVLRHVLDHWSALSAVVRDNAPAAVRARLSPASILRKLLPPLASRQAPAGDKPHDGR
jgi:glycosyltransferase involved in cell wall biosynthesis